MITTYELRTEHNPASNRAEIAVIVDGVHMGAKDNYRDAEALRLEIARKREAALSQGDAVAAGFTAMAEMVRAGTTGPVSVAPAPVPLKPRRRKASKPCTCPLCKTDATASGVYRCKAGQEWVAYHDGALILAHESFLPADEALKRHRYTLLDRPLPDATAEEVADVLASRLVAA